MFPSPVLDRLELVPTQLAFLILMAALHKVTMRFAPGHGLQGGGWAGIAEHIGDSFLILADQQPFLAAGPLNEPCNFSSDRSSHQVPARLQTKTYLIQQKSSPHPGDVLARIGRK